MNEQVLIDRQLVAVGIDCDILKYTYSFDGQTLNVFDSGRLVSSWSVQQLIKRKVVL
jgi:hypothetical protein